MNVAVSPTGRRLSWRHMLLTAVLCMLAPRVFAQAPSPADHRAQAVTQVVLGILSYARWPVEPAQLRLCIVGPTQYTDDLIKGTTQATGRPVLVQRLLADHPRPEEPTSELQPPMYLVSRLPLEKKKRTGHRSVQVSKPG